ATNTAACSFSVIVRDTTAPVIACSTNRVLECTSASGATVTFTTTASDVCDPSPTVTCLPASGSIFGMGTTTVTCTARDAATNTAACSFSVIVRDTTAPVIACSTNRV